MISVLQRHSAAVELFSICSFSFQALHNVHYSVPRAARGDAQGREVLRAGFVMQGCASL